MYVIINSQSNIEFRFDDFPQLVSSSELARALSLFGHAMALNFNAQPVAVVLPNNVTAFETESKFDSIHCLTKHTITLREAVDMRYCASIVVRAKDAPELTFSFPARTALEAAELLDCFNAYMSCYREQFDYFGDLFVRCNTMTSYVWDYAFTTAANQNYSLGLEVAKLRYHHLNDTARVA